MANFPIKINNVALDGKSTTPDGSTMPALRYGGATFSRQAIDSENTGRNVNGDMMREIIAKKDKWKFEFAPCTTAQLSALMTAIDGEYFSLTYPSPVTGASKTANFYVGDRSCPVLFIRNGNVTWEYVTFDVIEM